LLATIIVEIGAVGTFSIAGTRALLSEYLVARFADASEVYGAFGASIVKVVCCLVCVSGASIIFLYVIIDFFDEIFKATPEIILLLLF